MLSLRRWVGWTAIVALAIALLPWGATQTRAAAEVAEPFANYYARHQGIRVLGYPVSELTQVAGYPAQYFEKGRIEDHRADRNATANPGWAFMYGRLTAELMERDPRGSISGTDVTYSDLLRLNGQEYRHPAPAGHTGGTGPLPDGGRFVPYDPSLRSAPGFMVDARFWAYINRQDLFPGGWLHDIGLPMTDAQYARANRNGEMREIVLQAFERAVLTYDPRNPAEWQVERGNIGADAWRVLSGKPSTMPPQQVVEAFYNWYITYGDNPLTTGAYKSSPYLAVEFVSKVQGIIRGSTGGGYDPILCAQDVPQSVAVGSATITGEEATVPVSTSFAGHAFTVRLRATNGEWKITDVICTSGGNGPPAGIEIPQENARVILPLHLLARVGAPGDAVTASLRWGDGTRLANNFTLPRAPDGKGLLVGNLDWVNQLAPPQPPTQPATLEIKDAAGKVLASRRLTVVGNNDPNTQEIKVYWTVSGAEGVTTPQTRRVVKTERPGAAALEELLWGPPALSQVGFRTALPTPQEVLGYPGRGADWGVRVTLRNLTIENGTATADFSRELRAYGGGSARVTAIREQITQTLRQFPGVRQVRIAIEGQTEGVLEP